MTWLASILTGLLTGGLGLALAGLISAACVDWYRISSFEGGSGYFVVLTSLLGGLAGFVIGLATCRIVTVGGWKGVGCAVAAVCAVAVIAALLARLGADIPPRINGRSLEVALELRCPKGFTVPTEKDQYGAFASVVVVGGRHQPQGELRLGEARQEDGQWIVPASVPLATGAHTKYLRAYFNATNDLMFSLPLSSRPTDRDREWSGWIESGWDLGKPQPPPEARFNLRYRVQLVEPPPPEPTRAELVAQEEAEDRAKFEAVKPDAPIVEWFPYTRYGAPDDRRAVAIRHITAKAGYVEELAALMVADEAETAAQALSLVQHLPSPPAGLVPAVEAAGRHLAGLMREFNATPVDQDPGYHGAAAIAIRFSAWRVAVATLREKAGGDFIPELREILELSRARNDSYVMRQDVRRVASYYAQKWGGIEPLPGDPPPK